MRRTLISLTTAATLILGFAPAAQAGPSSLLPPEVNSKVQEVPAELRPGSSGAELLSSNPSPEQQREAAILLGRDWLIGFVGVAVIGGVIQAVSVHVR
ncbi:hypothetical protein EAH68_00425 [Corynebacterium hylobatis]|uniref:Uncharacterized protein n=1 Tax=Corynebacterium hylobatis TaxID=1859290 RepID=A0A3S0BJL4_9CORY|nr:hypothetical protein [Corynebacterium hylobatis]RSZ66059.1 hypothetical protein EAH68_00425 [Corynebacterium hylobatis]